MATSPSYSQDPAAFFPNISKPEVSRSTEGPSATEWESVKEIVRQQYEKKPLKDVRVYMDKVHGFRATYVLCSFPLNDPRHRFF
jgi:hypothetical protein